MKLLYIGNDFGNVLLIYMYLFVLQTVVLCLFNFMSSVCVLFVLPIPNLQLVSGMTPIRGALFAGFLLANSEWLADWRVSDMSG